MACKIRSRQITDADAADVVDLLTRGFRRHKQQFWQRALERIATHPTPEGLPKYGYLLEVGDNIVGVILLISTRILSDGKPITLCNVSSWHVEPAFRCYATLFSSRAFKCKDVTYLNISPAEHVQAIIEAQGFSRYSNGQFLAFPLLSPISANSEARVIDASTIPDVCIEPFERDLLLSHLGYGCMAVWCVTSRCAYPFVFAPRIVRGVIPCAQLIYCRDVKTFVQFARPIGRFLAMRGRPLVLVDSNGPIPGLVGRYFEGVSPRYFRGPHRPRLGDLSYTEAAMFGYS